ncbi:LuxR family transcriptional regulator [uncultured Erythrobacter sp.]|uniref:helix-turn-helix transcriptional regulator n=1 Tax=uncultured Erythrobacter sp. TaxID=263913 RepID=UPI002624364F|nr:LuxR family transcriptional regulator [uncultured Erythrobacter sp.]
MQRYFDQIDALNDIGAVLGFARDIFAEQGIVRMSYHVTPLFGEPNSIATAVYADGFTKEWLACYDREGFRSSDPIPGRVMASGKMMTWQEAQQAAPNSAANEAYFEAMHEHGLIHGFGIALFGPGGRDAYAGFDFEKPVGEVAADKIGTVRSVAQAGHQRICMLLEQATPTPALSEREIEVLTWAARGKSQSTIATILDISPDTVKTYSKRIYAKLDVTDRVGAVVKALRLGLVKV